MRFMVTGALHPDSPIAEHVRRHGDGIRDIAFRVDDVDAAYDAALQRGGTGLRPPDDDIDDHGTIRHAAIATYGDTVHTLLDRSRYDGPFAPGFEASDLPVPVGPEVGLVALDHVVGNVELGRARPLGGLLRAGLRLLPAHALRRRPDLDRVLGPDVDGGVERRSPGAPGGRGHRDADQRARRGTQEEPDRGVPRLLRHAGRAAHRAAHRRHRRRRARPPGPRACGSWTCRPPTTTRPASGWPASTCPGTPSRSWRSSSTATTAATCCRSSPRRVTDRPTVFFEIIQREGATGFGEGNFKALFEAIEREQARRGNL